MTIYIALINKTWQGLGCRSVVECVLSMCKDLDLIPSTVPNTMYVCACVKKRMTV
jgi:hypothetical protein